MLSFRFNKMLNQSVSLSCVEVQSVYPNIFFLSSRRSCSLDVEVSASGFTKDLQEDAAVLHPAGPEGEQDDDDEESDKEETGEDVETEEPSVDVTDYNNALLELEGLKVSDTNGDIREEAESEKEEGESDKKEEEEKERNPEARCIDKTMNDLEEELQDEFPELADLSASNKEFIPFRY